MSKAKKTIEIDSSVQEFIDGRSYDGSAVRSITQEWIDTHMKNRENEFTKSAECSVFIGTWNVNAKKQEEGLEEWLLPGFSTGAINPQTLSEIYAVGFQEIVDLNAMNVALNSNNTQQRATFWEEKIAECLEKTGIRYRLIASKTLVGLLLVIFVKESVFPFIRDVRATNLGVGLMGMMGNKGGVSIRMAVYDSTVVFVCAHLAAHRENVTGRNADFKNIIEKSVFLPVGGGSGGAGDGDSPMHSDLQGASEISIIESVIMPRQGATRYLDSSLGVSEHEIVFFLGDLNYRIEDSLTIEEIFAAIQANEFEKLREKDQLNQERAAKRVFQGFAEGVLNFAPTYKYQPGTTVYETRPEKKLRAPAWCDRVLWKTAGTMGNNENAANSASVRQLSYSRAELTASDHKPVSASFALKVREVVESKEKVVFQELIGFLRKYASTSSPGERSEGPLADITGLKVNFQTVFYESRKEEYLEIRNAGSSLLHWHFLPKLEETTVCKRWLSLDKLSGLLLPGQSEKVAISIFVDAKTAHILNSGKDVLQDVIVLRVENSLDYYLDVKADYERSCFGMSIEDLVTLTAPIADTPLPAARPDYYLDKSHTQGQLSIPKELWRLVDALWATPGNAGNQLGQAQNQSMALREKDLFNCPGDAHEVALIRQALDQGLDFPMGMSAHSFVECLQAFLMSLPRTLLPPDLYPMSEIEQGSMRTACRKFLDELPVLNYNIFVYLLSFFREVLAESSYNRCTAEHLSGFCVETMTGNASGLTAPGAVPGPYTGYVIDLAENMTKEDRERRLIRSGYLQQMIFYLLTASAI